jgi:hypothetical protein
MRLARLRPPRIEPATPGTAFMVPGSREGGPLAHALQGAFEGFWLARWKTCPYCAERIRRNAVFCKHCHHDL